MIDDYAQRGIQTNGLRLSGGPISPHWSRNGGLRGVESRLPGRIAPPIMENSRSENIFSEEPVKGQAWAFPDPDANVSAPSIRASTISRRNSQASSFTNSLYSELNRPLPAGQHGMTCPIEHPSFGLTHCRTPRSPSSHCHANA